MVEPSESRALVGKPHTKHSIFGIGAGCALPFIENLAPGKPYEDGPRGIIDEFCEASSSQAIDCVNLLAQKGLPLCLATRLGVVPLRAIVLVSASCSS